MAARGSYRERNERVSEVSRYLVTGGAGYVGSHVVLALHRRGDEVVVSFQLVGGCPSLFLSAEDAHNTVAAACDNVAVRHR